MAIAESWCPTRRGLLRGGAGAAAAALLIDPRMGSARAGGQTFTFAVVSDTHLGTGKDGVTGEEAWDRALKEISHTDAEFVLHLGDLVHEGGTNEELYSTFMDIRRGYDKPVYAIPGNHDPDALFKKHVAEKTDTSFDHKGTRFILFDNAQPDSHDGFISDAQLKWVGEQMRGARDNGLRVIIGMHVAAHANQHPDVGWYVKPENGQTQFYDLLREHRDSVTAVLSGHFHCGLRGWNDNFGVEEIVFPSACWNNDRGLARNGTGYAFDVTKTGYSLIHVTDDQMVLSVVPFGDEPPVAKTY